jgi:uncharacterized protein YdaU (DUF1376 family)
MNDAFWIRYNAKRMFCDTADMSVMTELAHRRMFDVLCILGEPIHYDIPTLQHMGRVSPADWARVEAELRSKGWHRDGDQWLHDGIMATVRESQTVVREASARTAAARAAKSVTSPVTNPVTRPVTRSVTSPVNKAQQGPVTAGESESEVQGSDKGLPATALAAAKSVTRPVTRPVTAGESESESEVQGSDKGSDKALPARRLTKGQWSIARRFETALGNQWRNDAGKWIGRIKTAFRKSQRILGELENAITEKRIHTTPARYAEQQWKEFK